MKDRRENVILGLAVVGLVAFAFPVRVLGCSCVSPGPSEEETILQGFCSSQDVYEATVAGATCNCYPSPSATKELYCLNFSLNVHGGLEPSLVSRVTCENLVTFSSSVTTCSEVLSALAACGCVFAVDLPFGEESLAEHPLQNTTTPNGTCDPLLACNFSETASASVAMNLSPLHPCLYTVTVGTVYRGRRYRKGDTATVPGPDVLSPCEVMGHGTLQYGESYLVGIGGMCEAHRTWSPVSKYTDKELRYLKSLRDSDCNAGVDISCSFPLVLSLSLLPVLLSRLLLLPP